jgi:hypothetical protein
MKLPRFTLTNGRSIAVWSEAVTTQLLNCVLFYRRVG